MSGVAAGFWIIGALAGLGFLLAHLGVLDASAQRVLSRLAFFVASPALLVDVLSRTPFSQVVGHNLLVSASSVVITVAVYLAVVVPRWHPDLGEAVIGSLAAAYVTAGNLGIPIAAYVLGDVALMAPTLLLQLVCLTPLAMALMDVDALGRRPRPLETLLAVGRNPMTVCALAGVVMSLVGWRPPDLVMRPVEIVGGMAVPAMLLAFGVSLRLGPRPGASGSTGQIVTIVVCKLGVQPLAALALASALGLTGVPRLAAVVTAALPCAQNVFTHAVRYDRSVLLARDAVLLTTLVSLPVIAVVAVLVH